jgi:hypothetical protein
MVCALHNAYCAGSLCRRSTAAARRQAWRDLHSRSEGPARSGRSRRLCPRARAGSSEHAVGHTPINGYLSTWQTPAPRRRCCIRRATAIQPCRCTLRARRRRRPSRKLRIRGPVIKGNRSWDCAASRGLPRREPSPPASQCSLRHTARIARSPRGAFCLAVELLLPATPVPLVRRPLPATVAAACATSRRAGPCQSLRSIPPQSPAREPLTRLSSSRLSSRDDELRGTAATAKRCPPTRQNGIRRDSESRGPVSIDLAI